jgi:tetratricopeptide (TPR) repeat protein
MGLFTRLYLRLNKLDLAEEWLIKLEKLQLEPGTSKALRTLSNALQGKKEIVLKSPRNYKTDEAYAVLGMKEEAIAIMQNSIKTSQLFFDYIYLLHSPYYDNLRDDSRFQQIMKRAKEIYEERMRKYGDL